MLRSEDVTDADRRGWRTWLEASPEHRMAWQRVESVRLAFEPLSSSPQRAEATASLEAASRTRANRRHLLKVLSLTGATVASAWMASRDVRWAHVADALALWNSDHRTVTGEIRRVALADGGVIWLNTASAVRLIDNRTRRGARLLHGEIYVETHPDPLQLERPFVIDADGLHLQALGTRFSVRRSDAAIELAVFEGAVASVPMLGAEPSVVVHAGRQRHWRLDTLGVLGQDEPVDANRAAWTQGVLLADAMRLDAFIAELAPHWNGHLGCDDDAAHLLVTGVFPLTDPPRIAAMLTAALPVRFHAPMPWWTSVEAR